MTIDPKKIRNIAVVGHGGSGKTSLVSAMLFNSSAVNRLGKVDAGTTTTDYTDIEIKRRISINSAYAHCQWEGLKHNLLDTPGYGDFIHNALCAIRVADAAIITVCAVSGVEVYTERVWEYADKYNLPRIVFINKLDRERANYEQAMQQLRDVFKANIVPFQLPIGQEASFRGVVDIILGKAYEYANDTSGKFKEIPIPDELSDLLVEYKNKITESVAETDETLMEKYFMEEPLTEEEISNGLYNGVRKGAIIPVFFGSALQNIGIQQLMNAAGAYFPSPLEKSSLSAKNPSGEEKQLKAALDSPFSALVFATLSDPYAGRQSIFRVFCGVLNSDSTTFNSSKGCKERIGQLGYLMGKDVISTSQAVTGDIVCVAKLKETATGDTLCDENNPIVYDFVDMPEPLMQYAIEPKSKGDEEKISNALARIGEEDMAIKFYRAQETGELIIAGMGQLHIEVAVEKMKNRYGLEVTLKPPQVAYKETIRKPAKAQGRYKKQTGGRGQFGDCHLELSPLPRGAGFEFVDTIFGGAIPKQYIPAVEKGVLGAMEKGPLAGFPVVDIKVNCYDGSYHEVDSSEMAFKIAGSMGFKKGFEQADPFILEPIMNVTVTVPEDMMGDIIGDINSRRGRIMGMEPKGSMQVIKAQVPQAEMLKYEPDLRSMTGGRGSFTISFSHYEELPSHLAEKLIAERRKLLQSEEER